MGCSETCLIEDNYVCPEDNSYPNLLCSDRCQDGEYDGPYAVMGRATDQMSWPYRNTTSNGLGTTTRDSEQYNEWDDANGQWTNTRLMSEECDTNGDLTCCNRMC